MHLRLLLLAVAVALLPACDRGQDPTIGADGTVPGSSVGTVSSVPPDTAVPGQAPPLSTPPVATRAHLTDVRVGAREGGDRVVFEFDSVVPGYKIDYVERPVTEDGSGDEVQVRGTAILQVRMENASSARLDGEEVVVTYDGPRRVRPNLPTITTELVQVGDFEGVLTWVIGVSNKVPALTVSALGGPSRLVLDLPAS